MEDGELRGAGLIDRDGRFNIALRDRRFCAAQPDLRGFDVVALTPSSRASLDELAARCDALGVVRRDVVELPDGSILDVPDPDGTVLRFYHFTGRTDVIFTGIELADGYPVRRYSTPVAPTPHLLTTRTDLTTNPRKESPSPPTPRSEVESSRHLHPCHARQPANGRTA